MSTAPAKSSRLLSLLLTPLLACSVLLGLPGSAQAATVTSVVFNNVSNSAALNATPTSRAEVDDLSVESGGTLYLPASARPQTLAGWIVLDDGTHEAFHPGDYTVTPTGTSGDYTLTFARDDIEPITARQSAEVPAMFITTGSGLAAIEADKDFEDLDATMAMVDANADATYNDALSDTFPKPAELVGMILGWGGQAAGVEKALTLDVVDRR